MGQPRIFFGEHPPPVIKQRLGDAPLTAESPLAQPARRRHLRPLRHRAHDLVRAELYPIHRLAKALRQHRQFSGEEAESILTAARAELTQSSAGSFHEPIPSR
jgi:hypothetical protein